MHREMNRRSRAYRMNARFQLNITSKLDEFQSIGINRMRVDIGNRIRS